MQPKWEVARTSCPHLAISDCFFFLENKSFAWVSLGDLFLLCLIPISRSVVIPTTSYHVAHDHVHWIEFAQKNFDRSTCIPHLMSSPTLFTLPNPPWVKVWSVWSYINKLPMFTFCTPSLESFALEFVFLSGFFSLLIVPNSQCCQSSSFFFIKGVTGHDVNNQSSSNIHTAPMCSTHAAAAAAAAAANSDGS